MASRAASHSEDCASTTPSRKRVVEPGAIAAAVEAEAQAASRRDQARDALVRDLEAARYGADRAFGQYDAIDPQNRLVAAELELRWNRALTRVSEIESRIAAHDAATSQPSLLSPIHVAALAAVRQLVLIANDDLIAGILNRNGLMTGHGNRWTRERVTALRSHHKIPVFRPAPDGNEPWLNLNKAARLLGIAAKTLRRAAEAAEIEGVHPLPDGPWIFGRSMLGEPAAQRIAHRAQQNPKHPTGPHPDQQNLFASTT